MAWSRSVIGWTGAVLGAQHRAGRPEGVGWRRKAEEGLKQQRVERDHPDDRAASNRQGQAPAHNKIVRHRRRRPSTGRRRSIGRYQALRDRRDFRPANMTARGMHPARVGCASRRSRASRAAPMADPGFCSLVVEVQLGGWGTWIRTRTRGVRVHRSTVKLSPTAPAGWKPTTGQRPRRHGGPGRGGEICGMA